MLNRHKNLFQNELSKFNDEIEMLILFLNEKNVIELKQTSFSFIARNRKIIDEILDFLLYQDRLQKMSLKQIFLTTSSTFMFEYLFFISSEYNIKCFKRNHDF